MLERFNPGARKVCERALKEALQLGHPEIGEEHLLLAMLREPDSIASLAFAGRGNNRELRQDVINYLLSEKRKEEEKAKERLSLSPDQVRELMQAIQHSLLSHARED